MQQFRAITKTFTSRMSSGFFITNWLLMIRQNEFKSLLRQKKHCSQYLTTAVNQGNLLNHKLDYCLIPYETMRKNILSVIQYSARYNRLRGGFFSELLSLKNPVSLKNPAS